MDSFYIGNLKGVGKVYQLTAIDIATRWAIMLIVIGPVTAEHTIRFIDHVIKPLPRSASGAGGAHRQRTRMGRRGFRAHLAARASSTPHPAPLTRTTTRSCERFQGTALQECWRPAFHRRRFTTIRQLQAEADAWLIRYHHRRRNHSDYMRGRTPAQILDNYRAQPSIMTTSHRATHLSPRPPAGKP